MISRTAEQTLHELARTFKVIALTGPRQSGKTTLARYYFQDKKYVSLENPDEQAFDLNDPRKFLKKFLEGEILDEVSSVRTFFW